MNAGDRFTWQRTFSTEDVQTFARVSGDQGAHHLTPDAQGRLMVHGLLTATLPTKLGGDLNYIAREMHFHFERPVFAGDTIRIVLTATRVREESQMTLLDATWVCTNQRDQIVMTGSSTGLIRRP